MASPTTTTTATITNVAPPTQGAMETTPATCQANLRPVIMWEPQYRCGMCNRSHFLYRCPLYRALTPKQRYRSALTHGYYLNCLARSHNIGTCTSEMRCRLCNAPHHTSLHVHTDRERWSRPSLQPTAASRGSATATKPKEEDAEGEEAVLPTCSLLHPLNTTCRLDVAAHPPTMPQHRDTNDAKHSGCSGRPSG